MADGIAVGVKQIQFGDGGVRFAVVRVQGFEAENSPVAGAANLISCVSAPGAN